MQIKLRSFVLCWKAVISETTGGWDILGTVSQLTLVRHPSTGAIHSSWPIYAFVSLDLNGDRGQHGVVSVTRCFSSLASNCTFVTMPPLPAGSRIVTTERR